MSKPRLDRVIQAGFVRRGYTSRRHIVDLGATIAAVALPVGVEADQGAVIERFTLGVDAAVYEVRQGDLVGGDRDSLDP
jgi:hypothetical protein